MPRFLIPLLVVLTAGTGVSTAEPEKGQWIVVTAVAFRDAITPLCEHRKADGLQVVIVSTSDVLSLREIRTGEAGKLREHVAKLCRGYQGPSYVLLVGAIEIAGVPTPLGQFPGAGAERKVVPALPGVVGRRQGLTLFDVQLTGLPALALNERTDSLVGAETVWFSPDGRRIASTDADGNVLIWDGTPTQPVNPKPAKP